MKTDRQIVKLVLLCGLVVVGSSLLQWLIDSDLGLSWPHSVLRNWEQYGFTTLKGRLAFNPGGHGALQHPEAYLGMQTARLYPASFVGRLLAWTGLHALPFDALLALAAATRVPGRLLVCRVGKPTLGVWQQQPPQSGLALP